MSLFESHESNGSVSLKDLFDGKTDIASKSTLTIEQLAKAICRGGWPAAVEVKLGMKQIEEAAADLLKLVDKVDKEKMNGPSFLMILKGFLKISFFRLTSIEPPFFKISFFRFCTRSQTVLRTSIDGFGADLASGFDN